MQRLASFAALTTVIVISGCSSRISHKQTEPTGASTTVVEIAPLDSPPPIPIELPPNPQLPIFDLDGTGNIVVFGDVHHHHHRHFHEAPEPLNVRVDVRVEVDLTDDRERRRRLVERRLTELLDRH